MFGTADGVYEATDRAFGQDTGLADLRRSPMLAETPVLWLGDFIGTKRTHTLILQATGVGRFFIDAVDEEDRDMGTIEVNLDRLEEILIGGMPHLKPIILFHLTICLGA